MEQSPLPISAIDYCFINLIGGGIKPYKIVIYGDNGSGKPGALLYISPLNISPPGTGSPQKLTHFINPPINVPINKKFFVGYRQTSIFNINACYQSEVPVRTKSFFYSTPDTSNSWTDFSTAGHNFVLDITARTSLNLNLKVYLEGFYDGFTMTPDSGKVIVRSFYSPYAKIDSGFKVLSSSGNGIYNFTKLNDDSSYYFVVKHRNHIETWSHGVAEKFDVCDKPYDFTISITQAYGNNMTIVNGRYVLFGGDINQDGSVDVTDLSAIDNDAFNLSSGYISTDANGDGFVDLSDLIIADNNAYNFVSKVTP